MSVPTSQPAPDDDALPQSFATEEWLDQSRPQSRTWLIWMPPLALAATAGSVLMATVGSDDGARMPTISLLLLGVAIVALVIVGKATRDLRSEKRDVRAAEDLVLMRRWPEAIEALDRLLTRPMKLGTLRRSALLALMRVLNRYEQFDDAVMVADEILDGRGPDPATSFAIRCGRTMALLQADRLADASDAIGRLRREVKQIDSALRRRKRQLEESAEAVEPDDEDLAIDEDDLQEQLAAGDLDAMPAASTETPPDAQEAAEGFDSAALLLIEMYRDIQTYHTDEVLETFEQYRDLFRRQLGLRLGDAMALAAVAAMRNERPEDAERWWSQATLLVSADELKRRYPEVIQVAEAYSATDWPRDATDAGDQL